jgi:hypothetical protein
VSDYAGVDPDRVARAASALENLRDTLAAQVPTIVNTMSMYGSPVSLAILRQAQARSVIDAADMRARSQLAYKLAALDSQMGGPSPGGLVTIPWDGPTVDAAAAQADAQLLAQAESNPKDPQSKADIQAIALDIQDHLSDPAYLTAFYDQAAPMVAKLATTLHDMDAGAVPANYNTRFAVLTPADEKILATFGAGLAAADKAGLSPQATAQIANAPDLWSASMLIKFGPPGSAYATQEGSGAQAQPSLLAQLTENVFQAQQAGQIQLPLGGWSVGINDAQQIQNALAAFDPLSAMLQRDAENKDAAGQVLGGQDGNAIANMLLNNPYNKYTYTNVTNPYGSGQFPPTFTGYGPTQKLDGMELIYLNWLPDQTVANFLEAATSGGRGTGNAGDPINPYRLSAQAAMNIIDNTPAPYSENGQPQPSFSPAVQKALDDTFLRYLPDIAASSGYGGTGSFAIQDGNQQNGPWVIKIADGQLSSFLMQLSADPSNYGYIKAAVASKMGVALGLQLNGYTGPTQADPFKDLASLYGRLVTEEGNLHFDAGQQQDAENAELNAMISFGESFVGDIPVVGGTASKVLSYDQQLAALGFPQIPQFSTDNGATALQQARQNFSDAQLKAMIPLVQGLVQQGIITPQPSWYHNGQIIPNNQFWQWWSDNDGMPIQDRSLGGGQSKHLDEWYQETYEWMKLQNDAFGKTQ